MKVFLSLCLLFSLVSPAMLQTCRKCENYDGTECTAKESERCYFGVYACKSALVSGNLFPFIKRAHYACDSCKAGDYALTTGANGSFSMAVRCCKSNKCNANPLEIPSIPTEPNGRECTGCYAENQEKCEGVELVKCSGNQTKCLKMTVEIQEYNDYGFKDSLSFSARGCATPDMCNEDNLNNNLQVSGKSVYFNVECCNAL